jgi:hypothetical protein
MAGGMLCVALQCSCHIIEPGAALLRVQGCCADQVDRGTRTTFMWLLWAAVHACCKPHRLVYCSAESYGYWRRPAHTRVTMKSPAT